MSDHISPSSRYTNVDRVQPALAGERLFVPVEDLETASIYMVRFFVGDYWRKTERVREGEIYMVEYYAVTWPAPSLIAEHMEKYPDVPCELWNVPPGSASREQTFYRVSAVGELTEVGEMILDVEGDLVSEERRRPDGTLVEHVDYLYDDEREVVGQRFTYPDGKVIEELYDE